MNRLVLAVLSYAFRWFLGVARPIWAELLQKVAHFDTVPGLDSAVKQSYAEEWLQDRVHELGYEMPAIAERMDWARRVVLAAVLYTRFLDSISVRPRHLLS